jgi:3,4-dihydroxy-2-butanone 4-phosphate synthase
MLEAVLGGSRSGATGVTTGISAFDRAHTIQTLINPASTLDDIAMPGHIFPLRARDGGVLERRGQTEAGVDLAKLAGLTPAGVICEVMADDGTSANAGAVRRTAQHQNRDGRGYR